MRTWKPASEPFPALNSQFFGVTSTLEWEWAKNPGAPYSRMCCSPAPSRAQTVAQTIRGVKRAALADYKKTPSERNLQILRAARNKVKQKARRCATEYWTRLSDGIPPNLLKHCKSTLQLPQHKVLS
ncbi:hypothetical protein ACOMHN_055376 [Nucella lapillus]